MVDNRVSWKLAAMAVASLLVLPGAAGASIVTLSVNGVFDGIDDLPSGQNGLEDLVGIPYALSMSFGTDSLGLIRTETDFSRLPVQDKAWFYDTNTALKTALGGFTKSTGGVVASLTDNFVYDGSQGLLPAGTYDLLNLTGWLRGSGPVVDPIACPNPPGGSLLGDTAPGPCSLAGTNVAVGLTLIATSNFFNGLAGNPLGDLDYSQVLYGTTDIRRFFDGVETGDVVQDPPLTFSAGRLTGDGMSIGITVASAPEPASWVLMITGFGLAGSTLRRRRVAVSA